MRARNCAERALGPGVCGALAWSISALARAHAAAPARELPSLSQYVALGFEHIVCGFDHLAFVLALALGTRRARPLCASITAFTLGHSLSLSASSLGYVELPVRWVEPAIALSIVYVALRNVRARGDAGHQRLAGVFGFVHGFGFAGALREIGIPEERALYALGAFNLGVELGQLVVLAGMLLGLAALRRTDRPGTYAVGVLNAGLLSMGLLWAAQRVWDEPAAPAAAPPMAADAMASPVLKAPAEEPSAAQLMAAARACALFVGQPRERRLREAEPVSATLGHLREAEPVSATLGQSCEAEPVSATLERACRRALAASLARGAIELREPELARCEAELTPLFARCELAAAREHLRGASCRILRGRLSADSLCSSTLECRDDLVCLGVGLARSGVCGSAPSTSTQALDPLASYLPQLQIAQGAADGS